MDLRRLRAGEWIAALSGTALLVSLFLPWYGAEPGRLTAWEALAAGDVILAVVAAAALALAVLTATQGVPAVPLAFGASLVLPGVIATVLVLVRVAWPPEPADSREWALWLGLAGAVGIVAGGWRSLRDERISKPGRPTDATGRPVPPPPEIDPIAAPRP